MARGNSGSRQGALLTSVRPSFLSPPRLLHASPQQLRPQLSLLNLSLAIVQPTIAPSQARFDGMQRKQQRASSGRRMREWNSEGRSAVHQAASLSAHPLSLPSELSALVPVLLASAHAATRSLALCSSSAPPTLLVCLHSHHVIIVRRYAHCDGPLLSVDLRAARGTGPSSALVPGGPLTRS